MQIARAKPLASVLPIVLPFGAIALARVLTFSEWAEANSGWAAILFAWIVLDAMMLGLMAKTPKHRPEVFQVLAVSTLAIFVILVGAAAPVRDVYLSLPHVLIAAGATGAIFAGWSALRIGRAIHRTGSIRHGLEQGLPPRLVNLIVSETQMITLALFRWGAPADVPHDARAFAYHTYLTPMIATILVLQLLELSVVHLLVMFWNPTFAYVLLALSIWGLIWTVALIKSLRINPVLLTDNHVRVRSGMIYDFMIPRDQIADSKSGYSSEELDSKSVLNLAFLSSPNVSLRLKKPLTIPTSFGGQKVITGVGLRLDNSAEFLKHLAGRD